MKLFGGFLREVGLGAMYEVVTLDIKLLGTTFLGTTNASVKYGYCKAAVAVGRFSGSYCNISPTSCNAAGLIFLTKSTNGRSFDGGNITPIS